MYASSPEWNADWISEDNLYNILEQLSNKIEPSPYGQDTISLNYGLHFTGGDPFLNYNLLCKAVESLVFAHSPCCRVEGRLLAEAVRDVRQMNRNT